MNRPIRLFHTRHIIATIPLMIVACLPAAAHAIQRCDDPKTRPVYCGTFSILFENDLFLGQDRHYTNGIKLSWTSRDLREYGQWEHTPDWARSLFGALDRFQGDREKNLELFAGQKLFTPQDIQRTDLIANDRPYAAWIFFGPAFHSKNAYTLDTVEIELGWVGPLALGEETQNFVHDLRGIPTAKGWRHQLNDEPAINLVYQHKHRNWEGEMPGTHFGADLISHYGASLGNVYTYASAGAEMRIGWNLPADFGTSLIRPGGDVNAPVNTRDPRLAEKNAFGIHAFAAVTGRAVLRDIFLDGNSFSDSHSVAKNIWVGSLVAGVGVTWQGLKLTYSQIFSTKEFKQQKGTDAFGSINLSWNF